jgi:hypothetical protein
MGSLDQRPLAALLLPVLSSLLIFGMFAAYLILRWHQKRIQTTQSETDKNEKAPETPPCPHLALKRPNCWLAVKNRNLLAVQGALEVGDPKPCSFVEAFSNNFEQRLFISPPVSGWILVMGMALPDPSDDVDACFRFMLELSRKLGHVQFFCANTMLNQHAWVQADSGRILRGYAWAGKTLWNQGAVTQAEKDLQMKCYDYAEVAEGVPFGQPEACVTNPDKVHLLAARWSVDPDDLDDRLIEQGWGIVGESSRRF